MRRMMLRLVQRTFFATALIAMVACGQDSPTSPAIPQSLPSGNWGGDHIALEVTGTGAKIEFDCATGTIDAPITLDRLGRFESMGTYTQGSGTIRIDQPPDVHPARYTGSSDGRLVIVTIQLTDTQRQIGTFTAVLGRSPFIVKCL